MKLNNILSLFDGMSCLQIALNRLGIEYDNYYSSEIDKFAIKATQNKFPKTIQLGDVSNIKASDLPKIDLMTGGFPCQSFSIAGNRGGFEDPRGKLFFELLRLKNELQPTYFLFENNESMDKKIQAYISRELGVTPLHFNSALVSAQNRERIYWTNINLSHYGLFSEPYSSIPPPKDKGILLKDILETFETSNFKTQKEFDDYMEKYYITETALARIKRNTYSKAKINPDKTVTLNTKNNSGQLSVDSGTTLIIKKDGGIKANQNKASCFTAGGNSGGNHSDMDLIVDLVAMRGCLKFGRTEKGKLLGKENAKNGKDYTPHREKEITGVDFEKMNTVTTVTSKDNLIVELGQAEDIKPAIQQKARGYNKDGIFEDKTPTLTGCSWQNNNHLLQERIRRLTPIECARLQTVPDDYFKTESGENIISESQQYRCLGNGWTIDIICHILSYMK
jgi:DNA-cytosine methyltransferase